MVTFVCGTCGDSLKKKQVDGHFYSCQVSKLNCLFCGLEYTDDSWRSHDGSCMTIDAEKQRTFGQFYKPKKTKGSLFVVGARVQTEMRGSFFSFISEVTNLAKTKAFSKFVPTFFCFMLFFLLLLGSFNHLPHFFQASQR